MGLVSWTYLYLRLSVYSGTRTQYRSLQMLWRYPLTH
ncbi:unnamed protein product [Schistosoma margrebowiei]|uniref:Uncharacterized protein n=1 Tax=Schistosoma margrebowiei TaxID=48269 RepID=A0A3P7X1D0_9TREM|nr:unnamed protein product [Schistosoma margrebowiei]